MVSTRQMSITTVSPEAGSSGVNTNSGSSRMTSNTLSQQSSNSTRQQSNHNSANTTAMGDATQSNIGAIIVPARQIQLTDMPVEIFERIFQYTGYKEVSNMRLVSTQTNQICKTILNSTFTKLQTQLMKRFQNIKKIMPRRESARRSHPLSYECDIIETCCMRLSLLQMTFGRYIEHKHICFFPGAFLDEVYNVLNYIRTTPNLGRPYKITEELIDLSTMAMEFFKDHLEPSMPQFGLLSKSFFGKTSTATRAPSKNCYLFNTASTSTSTSSSSSAAANSVSISTRSSQSSSMPSPPQSNMVLRKGIRKIKQGMKKYNNQLSVLRTDLRFCKRKSTDQAKQITELQNMLAEQQKQTLEYANRLDENDKKSEEMSSKISTLLQELNKCKIELHYYRSKSPATPICICNNCGQTTLTIPPGNLLALMKQNNINSSREEIINVLGKCNNFELESKVQSHESSISQDLTTTPKSNAVNAMLLMHNNADDNTDALNDLNGSNTSSTLLLSPEYGVDASINGSMPLSSSSTSSSGSGVCTNVATPINRGGIFDSLEKRLKFARHKANSNQNMTEWQYAVYDKTTSVIENSMMADTSSSGNELAAQTTQSSNAQQLSATTVPQDEQQTKQKSANGGGGVILTVGTPRFYGKRKLDDGIAVPSNDAILNMSDLGAASATISLNTPAMATTITNNKTNASATNNLANSNLSDNYNKKARRVQNKLKIHTNNTNIKTRNK
ncbi:uncharacterized protein LOC129574118 [Sitodiplosis mosellana]|uniref:uncharacterized protein LOC129574118 n=1 Tax=Sitodiplosis mosellana TaxID=263140 RepID=UPI00244408E9|nr:uncharacterized protein LOC129574118 [Sitodiplosis mosellana]